MGATPSQIRKIHMTLSSRNHDLPLPRTTNEYQRYIQVYAVNEVVMLYFDIPSLDAVQILFLNSFVEYCRLLTTNVSVDFFKMGVDPQAIHLLDLKCPHTFQQCRTITGDVFKVSKE